MIWLSAWMLAALLAATTTKDRNLSILSGLFAANAALMSVTPAVDGAFYMTVALADLAMVFCALMFPCRPAQWLMRLSLVGMLVNTSMYAWYQVPTDSFMQAYEAYPFIIRGIELCQLILLFAGRQSNQWRGYATCQS